jgi:CheY-like chemotaxis protein
MPSILLVDDDLLDRELARQCLSGIEGLRLREAGDGEEALAAIAAEPPDLVLTDLRMPRVDGLELVARAREVAPAVPVILMTSQGSEKVAVQALQAGAASYVPKRTIVADLADTVLQVLEVAEASRRRQQVLHYLERSEMHFVLDNELESIPPLVAFLQDDLARLGFADASVRARLGMALLEALSNAMVHGNLEVGSDLRGREIEAYRGLIRERRGVEPYASRRVHCTARRLANRVDYVVRDQGRGFDTSRLPDPTAPENLMQVSGRGLLLIRTFMDQVAFEGGGTKLTMTKLAP